MRTRRIALMYLVAVCSGAAAPAWAATGIWVMNADGSDLKKVVRMAGFRWHGSPNWSRDGKRLAFDANQPAIGHCYVVDAAGGAPQDLGVGSMPSWSADDKQLVFFVSDGVGPKPGIWVMNADGQGREWLCSGWCPRWSPDGTKIALNDNDGGSARIFVYDTLSATRTRVLDEAYHQLAGAPAWSPDSKRLCFIAARKQGGPFELGILSATGSDRTVLTRLQGHIGWHPAWAPGSDIVLWIKDQPNSPERLFTVAPDTQADPVKLPHQDQAQRNSDPAWSPDGKRIAFMSDRD